MFEQIRFDVRREKLQTESGIQTEKDAIIRQDTGAILGIVGRDYKLVKHQDALDMALDKLSIIGKYNVRKMNTACNGSKMYATVQFPEIEIEVENGDLVNPEMVITNSYDGLLKFGFMLGALRLVCTNGLKVFKSFFSLRRLHTTGLDVDHIIWNAQNSLLFFRDHVGPMWKRMSAMNIEIKKTIEDLSRVLGKRMVEKATANIKGIKEMSAWKLYNVFTDYFSHQYKPKSYDTVISREYATAKYFEGLADKKQ